MLVILKIYRNCVFSVIPEIISLTNDEKILETSTSFIIMIHQVRRNIESLENLVPANIFSSIFPTIITSKFINFYVVENLKK